jgi:putative endonuclease
MAYVYTIINELGELYIGSTVDLRKRIKEHNSGKSTYTKNHKWRLVYYEAYFSKADVRLREKKLKDFGQSVKHLKSRLKNSLAKISAG